MWYVRSLGEDLFAAYLGDRGRTFAYEELLGGPRPDFRVVSDPTDVICEVVDPEPIAADFGERRVGAGPDPYVKIRAVIGRKKTQGAGAKGRLPYVIVIRPPSVADLQPYDPHVLIGAMLGDVAFSIPVSPRGPSGPTTLVTTSGGRMQPAMNTRFSALAPAMNTRFSALAVLWTVNPTRALLDAVTAEALRDVRGDVARIHVILETHERLTADGTYKPDLVAPRLAVFHNPHAAVRLPISFFDGPFDRQWADAGDGAVRLVSVGVSARALAREEDG
jgi:hypothetical protein